MNSMIYSSYKSTWANHGNWNGLKWLIKSSWILTWILHKERLSSDDVLFPFKHHFFGKHRCLPVILWFLKISFFCISLFASFRFWTLTHFPKAVCPEYSPGGCSDHCFRLIGYSTSLSRAYDTLLKI